MSEWMKEEDRWLEQMAEDLTSEGMVTWFLKIREDLTEFRQVFWKMDENKRQRMANTCPQMIEDMRVLQGYIGTMSGRLQSGK